MVFFDAYCSNARSLFNAAVELNNERLLRATSKQGAKKDYLVAVRNDVFKRTKESFTKYVNNVKILKKSYRNFLRGLSRHGQDFAAAGLVCGETLGDQRASLQTKFEVQLGRLLRTYSDDLVSHVKVWNP